MATTEPIPTVADDDRRWEGVERPYDAEAVEKLRGSFTAVQHQQKVGAGYFEELAIAITGGESRDDRAVRLAGGSPIPELKALLFDVFGTCVDWRTSVAPRRRAALGLPRGRRRRVARRATSRSWRRCAAASASG